MRFRLAASFLTFLALFLCPMSLAQVWQPVGPEGGDVRSLVANPSNPRVLYLGTSDGHIFVSQNGGGRWLLLGRVGTRQDTVVMAILPDARRAELLFAATWTLAPGGGGVFRSEDGGRTWREAGLAGQTVRALAQAPSDPDLLIAGTLDGVYRTRNEGKKWERISPARHDDLLNFDSVAVDPRDPQTIYAGTYHLPWKTTDGGATWQPMHKGMIDDSDVMSIIVDRTQPERIFATACSGMYRSENRGDLWAKIKGIPPTSRRTHFIRQHPHQPQTFYAGTTEGLWKSTDGSLTWKRVTSPAWSIIGLVMDPWKLEQMVLAVERRGIYVSDDGGKSFRASNDGFLHRQIVHFAMDSERPERMLVLLTNAAEPVLMTRDGGRHWLPAAAGLKVEAVRRVYAAPAAGWWAALDRGGLMRFDEAKGIWARAGQTEDSKVVTTPAPAKSKAAKSAKAQAPATRTVKALRPLEELVNDMAFSREAWLLATANGLLTSRDRGATWSRLRADVKGAQALQVSADGRRVRAVTPAGLMTSLDAGQTWLRQDVPVRVAGRIRLAEAGEKTLLLAGERGLYISHDAGAHWEQSDLPEIQIADLVVAGDIFVVSTGQQLYATYNGGQSWTRIAAPEAEGRFLALSAAEAPAHSQAGGNIVAASSTESLMRVGVANLLAGKLQRANPAAAGKEVTLAGSKRPEE